MPSAGASFFFYKASREAPETASPVSAKAVPGVPDPDTQASGVQKDQERVPDANCRVVDGSGCIGCIGIF